MTAVVRAVIAASAHRLVRSGSAKRITSGQVTVTLGAPSKRSSRTCRLVRAACFTTASTCGNQSIRNLFVLPDVSIAIFVVGAFGSTSSWSTWPARSTCRAALDDAAPLGGGSFDDPQPDAVS